MTDEELAAIRARAERWERKRSRLDRRALLAEVDRLRAAQMRPLTEAERTALAWFREAINGA